MTTRKRVVADKVLARLTRKVWDLIRRFLEGSIEDPERSFFFLQRAAEGVPELDPDPSSRVYVLESHWSWDKSHHEFATISFEKCDGNLPFEDILNSSVLEGAKKHRLETLRRMHESVHPGRGGYKMVRLYRVLSDRYFGLEHGFGINGTLKRDAVDVHFILKPICEFDDAGNPISCAIERS